MRLVILGFGGHGKDTVCDFLSRLFDMTCISSSWAVCDSIIFPVLAEKYGYQNAEECHADRANHRAEWYALISEFNTPDKSRLAAEIFKHCDVYCGMRSIDEFRAAKSAGVFDYAVWVDGSKRLPAEPSDSCTIKPSDADYIIDNNGCSSDLRFEVYRMMQELKLRTAKALRAKRMGTNIIKAKVA